MLLGIFWGMDASDDKGLDFGNIPSFTDPNFRWLDDAA